MKCIAVLIGVFIWFSANTMAVEERSYDVIETIDNIEIRHYSRVFAAEVIAEGERNDAASNAFRLLFKYISGKNKAELKIPMTSPVSQAQESEGMWSVLFFMPADMSKDNLPEPSDPRVSLKEIRNVKVAAIRFSG
ncbi:SOUL heme-binding protein, partial [Candidatus Marinamargulisbacteria bacterium SCGC AG-343-D04]